MLWEQDEWLKKYCPNNEEKSTGSWVDPTDGDQLKSQFDKAVATGDKLFSVAKYEEARVSYQEAINMVPGEKRVTQKIAECDKFLVTEVEYKQYITLGDRDFAEMKYASAIHFYQSALSLKKNDLTATNKIAEAEIKLAHSKK